MKDIEIIEKVRPLYDVKEPDVLSKLSFDDVDIVKSEPPKLKGRYISAAVIYVAACLAVIAMLPFIISKVGNNTPSPVSPTPSASESVTDDTPVDTAPLEINIYEKIPSEYHEVLYRYRSAVEAIVKNRVTIKDGKKYSPYDPAHELSEGMYEAALAMNEPEAVKFGYGLKDLDWDGNPELLLITENNVLLEIYGIVDGKAELLKAFSPRNPGMAMSAKGIYTRSSVSVSEYFYTHYYYDGNGGFVPHMEFGTYETDGKKYFYKAEDGGEREYVPEKNFNSICKRYPEIPAFGSDENTLSYDFTYHAIAPTLKDRIITMLKKAASEGRIEERDFNKKKLKWLVKPDKETDMCLFEYSGSGFFVCCDGDVYPVPMSVPVYMPGAVEICDVDRNGKDDLLIYGVWGSGVAGSSLSYFDSNTKTVTELFVGSFLNVYVVEEMNESGDMEYRIYTSRRKIYVGTLGYEDGHIVTNLIREGNLSEIAREVENEAYEAEKKEKEFRKSR